MPTAAAESTSTTTEHKVRYAKPYSTPGKIVREIKESGISFRFTVLVLLILTLLGVAILDFRPRTIVAVSDGAVSSKLDSVAALIAAGNKSTQDAIRQSVKDNKSAADTMDKTHESENAQIKEGISVSTSVLAQGMNDIMGVMKAQKPATSVNDGLQSALQSLQNSQNEAREQLIALNQNIALLRTEYGEHPQTPAATDRTALPETTRAGPVVVGNSRQKLIRREEWNGSWWTVTTLEPGERSEKFTGRELADNIVALNQTSPIKAHVWYDDGGIIFHHGTSEDTLIVPIGGIQFHGVRAAAFYSEDRPFEIWKKDS